MKKVFLIFALLSLNIHFAIAQKILAGPRAGINLSNIDGLENNRIRGGWVIGAFMMYQPTERIGISSDVLVSSRGGRSFYTHNSDSVNEVKNSYFNINYLEVPVLANVFLLQKNKGFRPRLFAGPSFAFKINATENIQYHQYHNSSSDTDITLNKETTSSYKKADIGILLGLGFTYQMAARAYLNVDVRYLRGLIDIRSQSHYYSSSLFNQNVSILLGVGYQIGK